MNGIDFHSLTGKFDGRGDVDSIFGLQASIVPNKRSGSFCYLAVKIHPLEVVLLEKFDD